MPIISGTRAFTLAAYLQADGQIDIFGRPLKLQGGLRYVTVDTDAIFRARFHYGETLRRPNFGDINPNYSLTDDLTDAGYGSGSAGTATLKPTTSNTQRNGIPTLQIQRLGWSSDGWPVAQ